MPIKYCNQCGELTTLKIPHGDNLPRAICDSCGFIQYENPRVIVGCIPEWEDKILLCRRAIEPRLGFWTLPAGFLENNETTQEGALRETREEANASATIIDAFSLIDIPHINQIYLLYRAKLDNNNFITGVIDTRTPHFTVIEYGRRPRGRVRHVPGHGWEI